MNIDDREKETLVEIEETQSKLKQLFFKLERIAEEKFEQDNSYIKCNCLECNAVGHIRHEDKKIICPTCNGKRYMWVKKFDE